ncbi:thiamine phosphate synthase [Zavarzinia sp. CC-PAN008]|uniref:thiamine phosphate synthase n=1 Tax=Zavarzinia sp. CC-PAN008 TaxID=3243332 RepID=UPI003F742583
MEAETLVAATRKLNARRRRSGVPPLVLVTDARRLPDPLRAIARLPRGSAVLVRDYDAPQRAALARHLARAGRARGLIVLVAGDRRLARDVGADGVHLPEFQVGRRTGTGRWRSGTLLTAAAHSAAALARARVRGVDAVLLSPVFPTASHPGAPALGLHRFRALVRSAGLPVIALGGVEAATARAALRAGAAGLAGIGVFGR